MLSTIIENLSDVIVLIMLFGGSIFIHEFGHFLVALKLGLVVDTFSIGFGPAIWKKEINGIVFKISWIPLGGYVALPQLDPTGMSTVQGVSEDGKEVEHRELPYISPAKKIAVAVAGVTGNVILAVVFAIIIWLSPGAITYKGVPVIESVDESSAAYASGLRGGDEILAINKKPVSTWYDVSMEMLLIGTSTNVDLIVQSGKEQQALSVPMKKNKGEEVPVFEGVVRQPNPCILTDVAKGGSAAKAGLQEKDIVKSFDGIKVTGADEFLSLLSDRVGKSIPIVVDRAGKEITLAVVPEYSTKKSKRALIGVGVEPSKGSCLFTAVLPDSPAEKAGLQKNDIVKTFDGVNVDSVQKFQNLVNERAGDATELVVERNGKEVALNVTPLHEYKYISIGAQPSSIVVPWMQEKQPIAQLRSDARGILRLLEALVTPKEAKHAAGGLGGPVMIIAALWMAIKISMFNAIGFIRFLNINLAILNLLPIPVLDGGHVIFALWEWITKRKANAKVVNLLVNACAIMLLGAILILTFRDVGRIFPGVKNVFGGKTDKTEAVTNAVPANHIENVDSK